MKKAALYLVLFSLLSVACGGNAKPITDRTTTEANDVQNEIEETPQYATVSVIPGSGVSGQIRYVNCSLSDDDDWGNQHQPVSDDEPVSFQVEPGRFYDFKCVDSEINQFFKWNVLIEEDGFEWRVQDSDNDNLFRYFSHPSNSHKGISLVHITTAPGCGVLSSIQSTHNIGFGDVVVEHLNGQFLQPNSEFIFRVRTHRNYSFLMENTYGESFFFIDSRIDEKDVYCEVSHYN